MSQQWRGAPRGHVPYGGIKRRLSDDVLLPVLAAEGPAYITPCVCTGLVHEYDSRVCPVSAVTTEWEQKKEARRTERAGAEQILKHGQMKKFKREVRDVILTLVNEHGVEYRLQKDGQHIFLYSGARGERPFKIAAMRPVTQQMRFLVPWVREHFPHIDLESGKAKDSDEEDKPFSCTEGCDEKFATVEETNEHLAEVHPPEEAEVIEPTFWANKTVPQSGYTGPVPEGAPPVAPEEDEMDVPKPSEVFPVKASQTAAGPVPHKDPFVESQEKAAKRKIVIEELEADGWERYVYPTAGPSEFFMVRGGDSLMCTADGCEYTRDGGSFAGVHLHEYTHTDKHEEMLRTGAETRKVNAAIKVERAFESVTFLAQQYGFVVMTKEEADRFKSTGKTLRDLEAAQAEIERLQNIVSEQEAKIALAKEAFGL